MGKVVTEVLVIPAIKKDSTGVNIFELLDEELKKHELSWDHMVSFCSDNANVMMGQGKQSKSVAAFVKRQNSACFLNGCTCHLIAIAARNASKELPVCIEDLLLDIMYHMQGSSNRYRQISEI